MSARATKRVWVTIPADVVDAPRQLDEFGLLPKGVGGARLRAHPVGRLAQDPERPNPTATSLQDMVAIAQGLASTHDLAAAIMRTPPP